MAVLSLPMNISAIVAIMRLVRGVDDNTTL
jgi:hypothetical protein